MPAKSYIIQNPTGLHARPARSFAEQAAAFPCEIKVTKGAKTINGKSTLAMLTLGAKFQETITVNTDGDQAEEALLALGDILSKVYDSDQ